MMDVIFQSATTKKKPDDSKTSIGDLLRLTKLTVTHWKKGAFITVPHSSVSSIRAHPLEIHCGRLFESGAVSRTALPAF